MEDTLNTGGRLLSLILVDLNKREIPLKMVQYEMVLELREFLAEHVYTCFFTHYYFEHSGARLNDYTELAELDLSADSKIYMRPDRYDEKAARAHIKKVRDMLNSPQLLSSAAVSGRAEQQVSQLAKTAAAAEGEEENKDEPVQQQYEDKLKKNYEEFMAIVERESKKEIPMPP